MSFATLLRPGAALHVVGALVLAMVLGLCAGTAARADTPMEFQLVTIGKAGCPKKDCVDVITADGEIANDTADKFVSFLSEHLRDNDLRPVVLLQSPGGTVMGAMQLGTVFRMIGAAVVVAAVQHVGEGDNLAMTPAACVSACVYAFIGGVKRLVPSISLLGIHRMVITENGVDASGNPARTQIFGSPEIVESLSAYTKAMGVDPRMIAYAETIAPEELHILTTREIKRWKLGRQKR